MFNRLFKITIRVKLLILLLVTAIVPFVLANSYWYTNATAQVVKNTEQAIVAITQQASSSIDNFLDTKLLGLLSHSQGAALLSNNSTLVQDDLKNFLLQDPDIISLTFVNAAGQEVVKVTKPGTGVPSALQNLSTSPEFTVPAFQYGKEYIGPAKIVNGDVQIIVSTPIVYPENSKSLETFSSFQYTNRDVDSVYGVLVGVVSLKKVKTDLESIKFHEGSNIHLTDENGIFLIHRNSKLIGTKIPENLRTTNSIYTVNDDTTPVPVRSNSVNNIPVLAASERINRTQWIITTEEPVALISKDLEIVQRQALPLFLIPLAGVFIISFLFSHTLTNPIKKLVAAAFEVGKGNFDYQYDINTNDELEQLAISYKQMAAKLKSDRNSLVAERNTISSVLNTIADGVIGLDQTFTIVLSNRAALNIFDMKINELGGNYIQSIGEFKNEETDEPVLIKELCLQETPDHKVRFVFPNKEEKILKIIIAKVPESIVSDIRFLLTMYDISKEQELEDMKLDFVSMAAHELRTPLTSIEGYLDLYLQQAEKTMDSPQKQLMDRIKLSTKRLYSLIESLLNITRIEKNTMNLQVVPTAWPDFVRDAIQDFQASAQQKKITLSYVVPTSNIPNVLVDPLRIREVLNNLIENAVKYTNDGGQVTISMESHGTEIYTKIADNGVGIPKQSIEKLFNKFYRVPSKLEMTTRGTGLGLYISKSIVELHKGKIWVESELTKGSTFIFSLPTTNELSHSNGDIGKGIILNPNK